MTGATVLTLTQPWAELVIDGRKRVETRSWSTGYRGRLLIHAAKGMPGWARDWARIYRYAPDELARGLIIGEARLVAVRRTEEIRQSLSDEERDYGDFADGRHAWYLEDATRWPEPIAARGALGLWRIRL